MNEPTNKWSPIVTRRMVVFRTFMTAYGSRDEVARYLGAGCDYLTITKNELSGVYLATKDMQCVSQIIIEKIKENTNFPSEHAEDCRNTCEEFVATSQECARESTPPSATNLKEKFIRYCHAYIRFAKFMAIPVAIERTLTSRITQTISERVGAEQAPTYLAKLMTVPHLSEFQQEQMDLLKLSIECASDPAKNYTQTLHKHSEKYRWLSCYNPDEAAYEDSYFTSRLEELCKQPKQKLLAQLNDLKEQKELDDRAYRSTLDELQLAGSMQKEVELLREYVYLRTYRVEMQSKANFAIQPLFNKISERFDLPLRLTLSLTPEEIEKGLDDRSILPVAQELDERCKNHTFRYDAQGIVLAVGTEAIALEQNELGSSELEEVTELPGTVAYGASPLRGLVQIVLTKEHIQNFQTGRILVTTMTTPEFVPVMKMASAIVTNEGGVLCHAAIVARELKKPCIIGTKIATQVLKDGDEVEVDAEKGIVRILKKNS